LSVLSDAGQEVTALIRSWKESAEGVYFAGAALTEQVNVDKRLSDSIIDELFTRARTGYRWKTPNAISVLSELRPYPRAGDKLLALARDRKVDGTERVTAAEALIKFGRADEAVPVLLTLTRDEEVGWWSRERAAGVLGQIRRTDEAVQAWLALARDEHLYEGARMRAVAALGQLGRADDLLALVRDDKVSKSMHGRAAAALGKLERTNEAAPILLALVCDEKVEAWVRKRAAVALGRYADASAVPMLERIAQEDKSRDVRRTARGAIEQIRERAGD
jgi:HEAT repeat protein